MKISGTAAAILSSSFGGTAIAATRFVVGATDPITLGALRFSIGVLILLSIGLIVREPWPQRRDCPAVVGLGLLFFALFPILFNAALLYTTAARGALALSSLPLLTLLAGAALKSEPATWRKFAGACVATVGVFIALVSGLSDAPSGAWRGDLLMVGAAFCMALYSVWSKPIIRRSGALSFTIIAMGSGATCLVASSIANGGLGAITLFDRTQWLACLYLGLFGAAASFFLWSLALRLTTPTRVTVSMTINPIFATSLGALLLGEPISASVAIGLLSVALGIWLTAR